MATCPSCGQENLAGGRFCSSCGTELADSTAHEVRKTVTVVFSDVASSTALGERLDPESSRRLMARYFDAARTCLERHGGTVEKFIGDAVMAVFGVPAVHEDDALRALRGVAELRDSLASLNDELERNYGVSLQLRIGVNTGEVVSGTEERLVTGDPVNVAARLEQAARPGEILIGEQTRRLARDAIEVEAVKPLAVRGKAEPLRAFRLLRVLEGASAFERRFDAPLVGREEELARLRSVFDVAVAERRCRLVTVLGPPGIGKSRVARELATGLTDNAAVLFGRCLPYGEGITYWPLVEIFREAGAEDELEFALAAEAPEDVFWSVRKVLERRARERPLVLVVDDIQWAEPTLLDLVEHLADWTRDAPLLLLCLARPELIDKRPAWSGQSIALEPLSREESDELIQSLLRGSRLEETSRTRIRKVAEGNPLFVEQLLAMHAEGGDLEQVPPTIHALLAARLDALPDEEQSLLERASVVGLEFEWEALTELAPGRRRPPGGLLAALVRKELIRPHEAIEDTFRFRHILIRDAAYERVAKELRSELHERVANWLDGRGEELEEIVAYHLEQAYRWLAELGAPTERSRELAENAAERLARSGRRAFARGDMAAAANLLERATALLPPSDRRRLIVLPSLGRALSHQGQLNRAEAVLSEAIESGEAAGERGVTADAAVALSFVRLLVDPQSTHTKVRLELEDAIRVFEELHDQGGLARALGLAGALRLWDGQAATAIEELEQAVRHAQAAGDRAQEVESLRFLLSAVLYGPIPVASALERIEDVRRRGRSNRRLEVTVLRARAHLEAMRGNFDAARKLIAEAQSSARELGLEMFLASGVLRSAGEIELLAGDAPAAERAFRPAFDALERMEAWADIPSVVPGLVDALYAQGRGAEAAPLIELADRCAVSEDVDAQIGLRRVKAKLLAQQRDVTAAERLAREAAALAAGTDSLDQHATALADLAEVLRLAGRPKDAAEALDEAICLCEQKGNVVATRTLGALLAELATQI